MSDLRQSDPALPNTQSDKCGFTDLYAALCVSALMYSPYNSYGCSYVTPVVSLIVLYKTVFLYYEIREDFPCDHFKVTIHLRLIVYFFATVSYG